MTVDTTKATLDSIWPDFQMPRCMRPVPNKTLALKS